MNTSNLNLTRRYLLALGVIAALSITTFVFLRTAITAQATSAAEVNVAGRQRMLSQRISRFALLYVITSDSQERESLKQTLTNDLTLFEESHKGLINGGQVRGLTSSEILILPGSPSPKAYSIYFEEPLKLDNQVTTFIAEARTLLEQPRSELTLNNPHLQYLVTAAASDILSALNTVTGQYQVESENAIERLQYLEAGVLGITLLALFLTGYFIFRPMVAQIVRRTQELEENYRLVESQNTQLASRARAIALSADVSRRLSVASNVQRLAVDVVEQVQSAFNYYHAHIYYLDEQTGDLIMAGGTGEAGAAMLARSHKVPKGRGLVGRAANTNLPVLVADVSREEGWLPNPLLPDTKSEVSIPISSGNRVLGVLDVQQNVVNGLSKDDVEILQSLASQVAISLQNARSLEEARAKAELETLANSIGQKIQRAATVEETLQTAIRELGLAIGASRVKAVLGAEKQNGGETPGVN